MEPQLHGVSSKRAKIGMTEANGRPLSSMDSFYFDNCFAPLAVSLAYPAHTFGNDKKLHDAFRCSIRTSPLLQTTVEGEGKDAIFRQLPSEADWPTLRILPPESDDDRAWEGVLSVMHETVAVIAACGTKAHRQSVRMFAARGKSNLALSVICPHHFLDGTGIGTFLVKFCVYAQLPRIFWPVLNRRNKDTSVPTFLEMVLKDQYHQLKEVDGSLNKKLDPNNFRFANYDFTASKLRGLDYVAIGIVQSPPIMQHCRSDLRKAGVSISSAFGGLAIKTLASLMKYATDLPEDTSSRALLSNTGMDTRALGKWGDRRDRMFLPVIGNFTCPVDVQVPFQDAQQKTVEQIAAILKKDFDRLRSDVDFRLHAIANIEKRVLPTSDMFCGVSSVVIPQLSRLCGLQPNRFESKIDFGPVPHVWFYVVTIGLRTTMIADVLLPIADLTPDLVRQTIFEAARGSALEPLLAHGSKNL